MTTYLTLVGILLLVVFPLLIPVAVTVVPFCSNRFGRIANWRKTTTPRPLPRAVPSVQRPARGHAAPPSRRRAAVFIARSTTGCDDHVRSGVRLPATRGDESDSLHNVFTPP